MENQSWLIVVVLGYFTLFIVIGYVLKRRIRRATDFLVAGRSLPLLLVVFTIAATHFGGGCIVGGCEWGAQYGLWPGTYSTLACGVACLAFAFIAGKFRKASQGITPPDFMEYRYGASQFLRGYHSFVYVTGITAIIASQLIGFGYIASVFGIPYWLGVLLATVMVGIYTVLSGMWGVAVTDFIQLSVCIVFLPVLMFSSLRIADIQLSALLSESFFPFAGAKREFLYTTIPMILGSMIAYEYVLRWQSAKSVKVAVKGSVIAGVLLILLALPIGVTGAAGAKLFPNVAPGDVLSKLVVEVFPLGLGVLFLSTLLVAITSTSDSMMTSLGALVSRDIYHKLMHPHSPFDDLKYALPVARIASAFFLVIAALIALFSRGVLYVLFWPSPIQVGALFAPLIGGMFWKGATREGAVAGVMAGAVMALLDMTGLVHWPERVLFPILGSCIIWVAVSLISKKKTICCLSRL